MNIPQLGSAPSLTGEYFFPNREKIGPVITPFRFLWGTFPSVSLVCKYVSFVATL